MQCTWQKSARLANSAFRFRRISYFVDRPNAPPPPPTTPAHHGRAASRAISFALRDGNFSDAYHILNAIRLANSQSPFSSSSSNSTTTSHFHDVASAFSPGVSPRLPSHTLLHGLIRQREAYQASQLAEQMMRAGMKLRTRSLEALFTSLAQNPSTSPQVLSSSENSGSVLPNHRLDIHPELISDSSTRFAVRLLLLARQSRQKRTHRMFKTLITLCLINGEIIIASLLFGVLVRDWQNRVQLGQQEDVVDSPKPLKNPPRSTAIYDTPFPAWSHLKVICDYIDKSIAAYPSAPSSPDSDLQYNASFQALANLAHLLDRRMLPIGGLVGLLQIMYKCPSEDVKVWVWDRKGEGGIVLKGRGRQVEVDAHAYFKNVLNRLALRLPEVKKGISNSTARESAPAPLTLQTYNTLLHYSLLHARSRQMADNILHHMLYLHEGMRPSGVTINVLENAVVRSRVDGIDRQWAEGWKKRVRESSESQGDSKVDETSRSVSELLDIAARYEQISPELVTIKDTDNYTLSTRIAYLTAHGRPEVVAHALPVLLPGIPRRARGYIIKRSQHDSAVRRAVAYGPVVLTSILSALMKTGRTGLAESVWKVMQEAERQSWKLFSQPADQKGEKVLSPWCLGIEAYTVMIKVYGKEARKGGGYGHDRSKFDRGVNMGKYKVVGWGRLWRSKNKKRRYLGRQLGMSIYQDALKEEDMIRLKFDQLYSKLQNESSDGTPQMRIVKNQLRLPQPDEHFFNAILDIVGRRHGMIPRSRSSLTRRRARSRLMRKWREYVWEGKVVGFFEPDTRLKEVAGDIRRYGFQVPLHVRRMLVGRDENVEGVVSGEEGRVWLKVARRR